ncbi:MAG: 4-alpha-glucanotransferase [Balneolaceae bacterium]
MRFERSCGTLVHPTSFPSPYGMGDLGPEARTFIRFLVHSGQSIWQVLPLGPTGYGNSPYASYSAFAGNHYLISPDILQEKGLLQKSELQKARLPVQARAEYEASYKRKTDLYQKAFKRFSQDASAAQKSALEAFKSANSDWLNTYAEFMACSYQNDRKPWNQWDQDLARRLPKALKKVRKELADQIDFHIWLQFEFFEQWYALKEFANQNNIRVVGDIPIFVDHNSADVWGNPEFFAVDEQGNRELVAGVPPDYFSETGQLWGNPLYRWDVLEDSGFSWWVDRFRQMFELFDAIRVDHFRGFDAYWEVKATEKTAVNGQWMDAPGQKLFSTIKKELGELPIIAEDLGVMTPTVEALRDSFNFPGMKILQFAFDSDSTNDFLPHNFSQNCVVYSGTHDNDTTIGWYKSAPEPEQHLAREYTRSDGADIEWELIRLGMLSVADQAIFPLQDFMSLDTEHRMNLPGTVGNNWMWRYTPAMLDAVDSSRIKHLVELGNRRLG